MSFQVALTGLDAATTNLEVISNNIANSNTNGFKRSRAEFADVYASSDFGSVSNATGEGVRVTNIRQQHTQGDINYTENSLDVAISGGGLFRLSDNGGGVVYSRAGAFGLDRDGYLTNATEQRLTGYQVDDRGTILPTLGELKIDRADLQPKASEKVSLTANIDQTSEAIGAGASFDVDNPKSYNFTTGATIFDSQGSTHVINYYFRKEDDNKWKLFTVSADTDTIVGDPDGYNLEFGTDGRLNALTDNATPANTFVQRNSNGVPEGTFDVTVNAAALGSSVDDITLSMDLASITQFDSASGVNSVTADGFSSGRLSSLDIDKSGVIFGRYSNGQSKAMGQIALANFSSLDGLRPVGDSSWAETFASGPPAIGAPGSASLGYIQSSALESSNVDVTEELVDMIGAQRSFQANAQIISVADTLTQTIINMRR
ncbi:MAG TPA: flagellar hook protein FlgE [Gammaproteobacteria bacterium]|nr:flagellar hook protein FlgE [Gammaproteobacteria bacterium]